MGFRAGCDISDAFGNVFGGFSCSNNTCQQSEPRGHQNEPNVSLARSRSAEARSLVARASKVGGFRRRSKDGREVAHVFSSTLEHAVRATAKPKGHRTV